MASVSDQTPQVHERAEVWLRGEGSREAELVFAFPIDDELNAAVKRLPGRWFDWRRRHWRVPADPRCAPQVAELLQSFPQLGADADVRTWLSEADRWRGLVSIGADGGAGAFVVRTFSGEEPEPLRQAARLENGHRLLGFDDAGLEALAELEGATLDDLARGARNDIRYGRRPPAASLELETDEDGEAQLAMVSGWDAAPARDFKRLPEARAIEREGRVFGRDRAWKVAVPADPALAERLQ
ncbi:MAG: hypothetical protein ACR2KP_05375, partial [Egibacteraceae bacterium]